MNAIMFILNNTERDISLFRKNIQLLKKNYLDQFPCEVVCLHESDFPKSELSIIDSLVGKPIKFIQIEFETPEYPKEIMDKIPLYFPWEGHPNGFGFSMGYRKMCRFMAGEVFNQTYLNGYKYIWKLDTDSSILEKIEYDVFKRMEESNAIYGFLNIQNDSPKTTIGLWDRAIKYFREENNYPIHADISHPQHANKVFYTNFEIFDIEWFRGEIYQKYYKFIEKAGGILIHRWGDHCIRYIGVTSLVPQDKIILFDSIHYFHHSYYFNPRPL